LGNKIGVHYRNRMVSVGLSAGLITQDPERKDGGGDGPVIGRDLGQQPRMGRKIICFERHRVYRDRTSITQCQNLFIEPVVAACGQHNGSPWCQACRQLEAYFAATTENDN
jgi:hypothetical protein